MTKKQILEGNILIAIFMGGKPKIFKSYPYNLYKTGINRPYGGFDATAKELIYHTSWDWLMPVVSKIVKDKTEKENITFPLKLYDIQRACFNANIDLVWKSVVAWIKEYIIEL
jgi:hypothetical protein